VSKEFSADRLDTLTTEGLDLARRASNLAELHLSRGESREASYAESAAAAIGRYAVIMAERGAAARSGEKVSGA
jgi:hypothetical protein